MCHEAKFTIFLITGSYAQFSKYARFCIFNHPMIYHNCDLISISAWDRVHFWIHLLNYNSFSQQTWPFNRYKQLQWFSGILWIIWRTGTNFHVLFNLATCSNYSITNYAKIWVFHFFEKMNKGHLKMVNYNCLTRLDLPKLPF